MIGAFLENPLYFGHSNFKFIDGVKSSNEVYHQIPTVKRRIITQLNSNIQKN